MSTVYNGSSATLSPWRSGESCLSKDQRETPVTSSTEVNQTGVESENRKLGEIGWKLDPVRRRNPVSKECGRFGSMDISFLW